MTSHSHPDESGHHGRGHVSRGHAGRGHAGTHGQSGLGGQSDRAATTDGPGPHGRPAPTPLPSELPSELSSELPSELPSELTSELTSELPSELTVDADPGDPVGGRLGDVAAMLEDRDRLMGRVAATLVAVQHAEGLHERLGGMTLQVWLEHVCRIPGADARAMMGAIDVLARMPTVVIGLADRWLSWPQVQAICRAARRAPVTRLAELDELVGAAMIDMAQFEPGALVDDIWQWIDAHGPSRLAQAERAHTRGEFVSLAPRLFGGGSLYGELGAVSFATVAEALDASLGPASAAPPITPSDLDDLDESDIAELFDTLDDQRRSHTADNGQRMARNLVSLCTQSLSATLGAPDGDSRIADDRQSGRARPLLVATIGLDALLDRARTPGWLLHTLAGGRMKLSASALQRVVDDRGADIRGIVLDDCGQIVGVGRTTRIPPQWLRHAIWARDTAVRDPDGSTPIRRADLDHITAWPDGATDVSNLHPLGRKWHNFKTSRSWTTTRHDDGTTTWCHHQHGWVLRMAPAQRTLTSPPRAGPPPADEHPGHLMTRSATTQPQLDDLAFAGVP